jgi:polyisoprenoid-binding protein YceI
MSTVTQPFTQSFVGDPVHSSFGFAVRHSGVSTFRGRLDDARATLARDGDRYVLEGEAAVASISIRQPDQLRDHILSADFFDAEHHPTVRFRSTDVDLRDDGSAVVRGELTMRGVTREVVATGTYSAPIVDLAGQARGALELEADVDRTDFGMTWQAPLPGGGKALDERVRLEVHLELVAA